MCTPVPVPFLSPFPLPVQFLGCFQKTTARFVFILKPPCLRALLAQGAILMLAHGPFRKAEKPWLHRKGLPTRILFSSSKEDLSSRTMLGQSMTANPVDVSCKADLILYIKVLPF